MESSDEFGRSMLRSRQSSMQRRHTSSDKKIISFSKDIIFAAEDTGVSVCSSRDISDDTVVSMDVGVGGSFDDRSNDESIEMEWNQEKARPWDPWLDGDYNLPKVELPNEVNFIGGLGPNVGHPRSTVHIQRATTVQKVYNMRTRNQPVFTFCEDPRKANNVVPKKEKIDYRNVKRIRKSVERVRLAQNIETPPPSDFSEDPTEVYTDFF